MKSEHEPTDAEFRLAALEQAVAFTPAGSSPSRAVDTAKVFEEYLRGPSPAPLADDQA